MPRLKNFKNLNHKVLILNVVPSVKTVINPHILGLLGLVRVIFGKVKELFEVLDEGLEQEVLVNVLLYLRRKLDQQLEILFLSHSLVLIVRPSVSEVVFNLLLELNLDGSTGIESFDQTKPS